MTTENKEHKAKEDVEYDDLLSSAGELGRYQWTLFFSTAPFFAFGVFVLFSQVFITEVSPNHWCRIPELANMTDVQRRDLGVPKDKSSRFGYSQCDMYAVNWTEVLATGQKPNESWSIVPCQYGWEFNNSEIPYPTIGSDFEWVCERNSYQATAQAIFFLGAMVGEFVFGWVADRFGRIPAIIGSCLVGCVGGFASTFARNFVEFTTARFVMAMSYDTCLMVAYLLILEYISPKHRTLLANMSFAIFYSLFITVLPWIALACGHWKTISLVTSLPLSLAVFTKFLLPESPRWLLSKGREDEAIEKVVMIGRINKREVPKEMIKQFKLSIENQSKEEQSHSWLEVFRRPKIRKIFILICLEHMCCSIVFDGLVRSIGQLEFDFFVSFSVISFTEFPSCVVVALIMDYMGRRWQSIASLGIGGIFCLLILFSSGIKSVIFAVVARFAINMSFSTSLQWSAELMPTPVRGSAIAVIHICGFGSSFLSPYIIYLKEYVSWVPLAILSATAAFGILTAFALPETAKKDMPHTFEEAENLTKKSSEYGHCPT